MYEVTDILAVSGIIVAALATGLLKEKFGLADGLSLLLGGVSTMLADKSWNEHNHNLDPVIFVLGLLGFVFGGTPGGMTGPLRQKLVTSTEMILGGVPVVWVVPFGA